MGLVLSPFFMLIPGIGFYIGLAVGVRLVLGGGPAVRQMAAAAERLTDGAGQTAKEGNTPAGPQKAGQWEKTKSERLNHRVILQETRRACCRHRTTGRQIRFRGGNPLFYLSIRGLDQKVIYTPRFLIRSYLRANHFLNHFSTFSFM